MKNPELFKEVIPTESELKEIVVNYVGKVLDPKESTITVEQIIEVFARDFPEFLLVVAEENWINGYTQALRDTESIRSDTKEIHSRKEAE